MTSWFARRTTADPAPVAEPVAGYREGGREVPRSERTDRDDERAARGRLEEAYERGRREERLRRHRHPIGMLALTVLALVGLAAIAAPLHYGSYAAAGGAADSVVASTGQQASAPVRGAADRAGDVLQNAGGALKSTAGTPASS